MVRLGLGISKIGLISAVGHKATFAQDANVGQGASIRYGLHSRLLLGLVALAGVLMLSAGDAAAKVEKQDERGFVTRNSATVSADPRKVWMTLISPADWWDGAHSWSGDAGNLTIVPQGGGCFCERIPAKEDSRKVGLAGSVEHMSILQAQPDRVLRMRGALGPLQSEAVDGVLTISLKSVSGGTKITFEYVVGGYMRFPIPDISKAVDGMMGQQLSSLAKKLGPIDEEKNGEDAASTPASAPDRVSSKPALSSGRVASIPTINPDLGAATPSEQASSSQAVNGSASTASAATGAKPNHVYDPLGLNGSSPPTPPTIPARKLEALPALPSAQNKEEEPGKAREDKPSVADAFGDIGGTN